ncbi:uncharacterized protein HMPREF1541_05856 [Cyphellophora europaea CBS 101466]|uniref:Transmembrane protein n=1 Tax=Cyphellophora europaea (strain CBS 101466) TaxID=1220924 RepID=W2RTI3_CYPE1|nr:uncharacterized protein HMPREF1541_05856 [Cyphellophora europaea CBS 101466]ETN39630.1 hypothetical protein HMPREF1541_05856 [Cyphellophora europaea CBS 101466]
MVTPTAARFMQASRARLFRPGGQQQFGFVNRENRVPFYQRLFQNGDGRRQWRKTSRSPFLLYPYYALNYGLLAWVLWGAGRASLGYKSPWGK